MLTMWSHWSQRNTLQDTDKPGTIIRDESGLQEPVQNHTPWKMVQTRWPQPRGNQSDPSQHGRPIPRDVPTSHSQAKYTDSTRVQLLQSHATESVRKYTFNTSGEPVGITCEDVDVLGKTKISQHLHTPMHNMHVPPSSSCPRPPTPTSSSNETMQAEAQGPHTDTPENIITQSSPTHGPFIGPKLVHPHSNRPRPPNHTHTPKQPNPATHSDHELPHTQSPQSSLGNGRTRTDLEWALIGML